MYLSPIPHISLLWYDILTLIINTHPTMRYKNLQGISRAEYFKQDNCFQLPTHHLAPSPDRLAPFEANPSLAKYERTEETDLKFEKQEWIYHCSSIVWNYYPFVFLYNSVISSSLRSAIWIKSTHINIHKFYSWTEEPDAEFFWCRNIKVLSAELQSNQPCYPWLP